MRNSDAIRSVFLLAGILCAGTPGRAAGAAGDLVEQPLTSRSAAAGATMFTELSPQQTGLVTENRYADPAMWWERYHEFEVGEIGTGVAIGDYDGDGRPDLFVVSKTESCRLFRNLGNWKFEDVTAKAGLAAPTGMLDAGLAWAKRLAGQDAGAANEAGIWKQGATFVDVNNDGRLDLYVCRFATPNLLYINQGDGTFKEEAAARGLALNDASGMAAFCDYDRDGWLDVYIHTNLLDAAAHSQGQRGHLFHNNRDGTFTEVTGPAGITGESQTHSATWWDYDNDGWPDLYVANDFAAPDKLYRNNHDGTFTNTLDVAIPHTPFSSMGADIGDVNNDGLIDFFVADMAATSHEKDQRGMAESRARNDADPAASSGAPQYPRNALFLGTGTGRCLEAACAAGLDATDWTWSVRLEDLDNDGRLDLHVTNGMFRESHNVDLLTSVMGAESPAERVRLIRASPVFAEPNLAFRNLGNLHFENVSRSWGLDQRGVSFGAAFGDFDGDGDLDLVYANYEGGVTILRNDCPTGHRLMVSLHGTQSNRFGVGATVQIETAAGMQVRQLVLARGYLSGSEPIMHFGLGADDRINRLTVAWPSGESQTFTDIAADQKLTITEPRSELAEAVSRRDASPESRRKTASALNSRGLFAEVSEVVGLSLASREIAVDETARQPLLPMRHNRNGPALAIGDLNGDGIDDVWVGGTGGDPARIMLGTAAGRFVPSTQRPFPMTSTVNDGPALVFDANGDGANDLLVTKGGASQPAGSPDYRSQLFLNNGHGGLEAAPAGLWPAPALSVGAVAAADFDRDGTLDVFIGGRVVPGQYPTTPASVLLANRGGRFVDVTAEIAPALAEVGMVTSALWSDVDDDGWPDLLLTLEWGNVKYFHNDHGRKFEDLTGSAGFAAAGSGWWNSLATADFNGDGRPDYVVGNLGLNTSYRATPEYPALLYVGDFSDRGVSQLIEAYYENGVLFPRRTRQELAVALPALRKRFPKINDYARATLTGLAGEGRLASAQRLAATEFRSGVFLSQPDGRFSFLPLPVEAQIAPLQGIVAGDFDGDGCADIYAVQNSFAPVPSIGRFDGGLSQFFRGDGHGNFSAVPLSTSGLIVPGDAKALVVLDLNQDGRPDFLVTRNNSTTLAFENQGMVSRHSLRILLRGDAGNPTAVGARITVQLRDGTTQTSEIYAGAGYLSQSTPACFFGWVEGNPPRVVRVRWPSGSTTQHEVPAGSKSLTLSAHESGVK